MYYLECYANADSHCHQRGLLHFVNADPEGITFYDCVLRQLENQMKIVEK